MFCVRVVECFFTKRSLIFAEPASLQNVKATLNPQGVEITWDTLEGYADAIVLEYDINNVEIDVRKTRK